MNVEKSRYIQVPAFLPARQIVFTVSIFIRWLILIFTPATEHACDEHHRIEQTGKDNGTANGGHEHAFCGWAGCDAENLSIISILRITDVQKSIFAMPPIRNTSQSRLSLKYRP